MDKIIALLKAAGVEVSEELAASITNAGKEAIDTEVSGLKNKNSELLGQNQIVKVLKEMGLDAEQVKTMAKDNQKKEYLKAVSEDRLEEYLQAIENKGYEKGKAESAEAFESSKTELESVKEKLGVTEKEWNNQIIRNELTKHISSLENVNSAQINDIVDFFVSKYSNNFEVSEGENGRFLATTDKNNNADNKPKTAADTVKELSQNHAWIFTGQTGTDTGGNQDDKAKGDALDDIDNASDEDILKSFGF